MSVLGRAVLLLQAKNYSGSGDWLDESGNGHDATPSGSPTFDGVKFTLNGTDQYFAVADHADLDFAAADDFTLAVWAQSSVSVWVQTLIAKRASRDPAQLGYSMGILGNDAIETGITDDSGNTQNDASGAQTKGTPFVAVYVRDQSGDDTCETFLDGASNGATTDNTSDTFANGFDLRIGRLSSTGTEYLNGDIYAVAVWREALSDSEVAAAGLELQSSSTMMLLGVG